jgi:hydrogenase-4 component F
MTGTYLISAFLIAVWLLVNRNAILNNLLIIIFGVLQIAFTIYVCLNYNLSVLGYFTFDSLGLLLLMTLSVITIPALLHSYLYIIRHDETPESRAIYFSALVFLITSITAAYLANHIAVIWIFTEMTTLSASMLIYHHRNKLALEGTWKYVFICAISITFVFIGILFLSLSLEHAERPLFFKPDCL